MFKVLTDLNCIAVRCSYMKEIEKQVEGFKYGTHYVVF